MNAEDQINMLKQIPPLSKVEKRRKLRTAIVLSLATLMSVLFFVFAYMQKLEADKSRVQAEANLIEAQRQEKLTKEAQAFAEFQRMDANRLNSQLAMTLEELQNCKKSKR